MTPEFEGWVDKRATGRCPIEVHREEAEFWSRAFVTEVGIRALEIFKEGAISDFNTCQGLALAELEQKFGI